MDNFDSVISIGGQAFLDGFWHLMGPALQAVRSPLPTALPGLTNAMLRIKNLVPRLDVATAGKILLELEIELTGEVLLTATVASGTLSLSLGTLDVDLNKASGTVDLPAQTAPLKLNTITGTIGGATPAPVTLTAPTGTVQLPPETGALHLDAVTGTITSAGTLGDGTVPFPAVLPIAIDVTKDAPLALTIGLTPIVNGNVRNGSGFGLRLTGNADHPGSVPFVPDELAPALAQQLESSVAAVVAQLPGGVTLDPALDFDALAEHVTAAIPSAIGDTIAEAFSNLLGRTGRLVFSGADASSCDVQALPTNARARIGTAADGSSFLQVGFAHTTIPVSANFPAFAPEDQLDVQIDLDNRFVLTLVCCLLEKLPNLVLLQGPRPTTTPTETCCTWDDVAVNLGILVLRGSLSACMPNSGDDKKITLKFDLTQSIRVTVPGIDNAPGTDFDGSALEIALRFDVPVSLSLDALAALGMRPLGAPTIREFTLQLGDDLLQKIVVAVAALPLIPGFGGVAILLAITPKIVVEIARQLLMNNIETVLAGIALLRSPGAIPGGIFDAFGTLVPAQIHIDDLVARGTLATPTSPWGLLPLTRRIRLDRPLTPTRPPIDHVVRTSPAHGDVRPRPGGDPVL